jgi:hypothetical protein
MNRIRIVDNFVFAGGVKIARLLPKERALEFVEPRTGAGRDERRRAVVAIADLATLCPADDDDDWGPR